MGKPVCSKPHPNTDTSECSVCETFVCIRCEKRVPWSKGAHDSFPDHCDDCWFAEHEMLDAQEEE